MTIRGITIRCTRSRGPRGFFCLQVDRRGPVNVDGILKALNRNFAVLDAADAVVESPEGLDLTEQQVEKLQQLHDGYDEMMNDPENIKIIKTNDAEGAVQLIYEINQFENKLVNGVLLPHQTPVFNGMLFSKCVSICGGDTLKTIEHYYDGRINLDSSRKEKLASISEATKKDIAEAKRKFAAELKKIQRKAEKATRDLFTDGEKRHLGEPLE